MVNLEELMESEKKPYTCPVMVVKKINFADVIVTSGKDETVNNGVLPGEPTLDDLEDL